MQLSAGVAGTPLAVVMAGVPASPEARHPCPTGTPSKHPPHRPCTPAAAALGDAAHATGAHAARRSQSCAPPPAAPPRAPREGRRSPPAGREATNAVNARAISSREESTATRHRRARVAPWPPRAAAPRLAPPRARTSAAAKRAKNGTEGAAQWLRPCHAEHGRVLGRRCRKRRRRGRARRSSARARALAQRAQRGGGGPERGARARAGLRAGARRRRGGALGRRPAARRCRRAVR